MTYKGDLLYIKRALLARTKSQVLEDRSRSAYEHSRDIYVILYEGSNNIFEDVGARLFLMAFKINPGSSKRDIKQ